MSGNNTGKPSHIIMCKHKFAKTLTESEVNVMIYYFTHFSLVFITRDTYHQGAGQNILMQEYADFGINRRVCSGYCKPDLKRLTLF